MNIKSKISKLVSGLLCFSMIFSNVLPAHAADAVITENTLDGEDLSVNERNLEDITVTYKQASSFFVTIPKTIVLDGWKQSTYAVKVSGDIGAEQCVYVAPVDMIADTENIDFYMKDQASENAKEDVVANVTHNKFHWNAAEVAEGYRQDDNLVSAPDLTAGVWRGIFQMEIKLETHVTHKHNYVETITKEPTCTETGEKTYTCDCGDSYTEEIPATGHHYGDDDKCTGCGELNPDHKHSYTETITKEPTTTEEGEKTYICRCGDTYTEAIPVIRVLTTDGDIAMGAGETAEAHAYINGEIVDSEVKWMSNNANITVDNGVIKTKASAIVGETADITVVANNSTDIVSAKSVLSKLGIMDVAHADDALTASFTVTVVDIEFSKSELNIYPGESDTVTATIIPTSIEGTVVWTRTAVSGINLVKSGNTVTIDVADDMTTGKSYDIIATFGEFSKKITVNIVSPHTHNYVATITKEATCAETGLKTFTCTCGDSYTELVPALGHNYASTYTIDVEATCTVEGSKSKHCSRCDAKTDVTAIPVIEHRYVDNTNLVSWENTSNGTYAFVKEGTKWTSNNKSVKSSTATSTWTITLDKDTEYSLKYKVSSEASYDKLTVKLDSTTIANAISGAGEEITYTTTLTAGTHTLTATYEKDTSTDKNDDCGYVILEDIGESNHKCTICNNEEAHDYQEIIKEATCTKAGEKTYSCSVCGNSYTEVIPATGHNYVNNICSECGDKYDPYSMASDKAYLDWNYTLDDTDNTITLNYYTGSSTDVTVYGSYPIKGKVYATKLASNDAGSKDAYMFAGLSNLKTVKFSNHIDTSETINMGYMFYNCSGLTSINVSGIDTSKVQKMNQMFYGCSALTQLDVSNFDTSNVTSMKSMFYGCESLSSLDIRGWNTENVKNMSYMFYNCKKITSLNLVAFDTSNVTDMSNMFYYCESLSNLDVRGWNTSNVTNMYRMFMRCESLTSINVSSFNTSNVTDMSWMFESCTSLTSLDLSNFDTSNVTNMEEMFSGNAVNSMKLTNLDLSNFNTSKVTDMSGMFRYCSLLTNLNLNNFDTSNVTNMGQMFTSCSSLTNLNVSSFNTSNVTRMKEMFDLCSSLTNLDVSNFDTSSVTSMYAMFMRCESLTKLDLSNFNTSKVTSMGDMFSYCYKLSDLNVSNFDTSNVTNTMGMFEYCQSLTSLDLSSFDTSKVTSMQATFYRCSKLKTIYATKGKWSTSLAESSTSNYEGNKTKGTYNMFSGCGTSAVTYK